MFTCKYWLLAALASALPIASSHATTELPIVRVTLGDLDLDTPAGISTLYKRVQHGAARYCEPISAGTHLEFGRCVKDAIATTVKKIDNTNLSAFQELKAHSAASSAAAKSGVENVESAF